MAANQRRMPQNAVGGGVKAGIRPEELELLRNSLASSVGKTYGSGSPRGESAGYTTSSPGWRQPAPPALFPAAPAGPPTDMSVAGPWGAGFGGPAGPAPAAAMPHPTARPDPMPTGGIAAPVTPTPEMIKNATTTPSALFQPFNGPVPGNATTSPSALFQPLPQPGAHGQPPAPQGIVNPASMGQPPAPQGVVDLPALGSPPAPQSAPVVPMAFPARPAVLAPNLGDIAAMPEGASRARQGKRTPLAKKGGRVGKGQYSLRKEAATS